MRKQITDYARAGIQSDDRPVPGDNGFHWSEIDGGWQTWTPGQHRSALDLDTVEPELMARMVDHICITMEEIRRSEESND